ncbi:MAG: 4Fe-4S dicluster domain-containing protein [Planctomycetes bacterium]|nr:4Fe-4S dicluster domain-containing protein [Planctomycetota bacterium]
MAVAILVDVTKCTGCEQCVAACVRANGLDPIRADADRATLRDGLSSHRLSSVIQLGDGGFARKSCMHCLEPSCAEACLVGGITKTPEGPVVYDPDKCIGCRYCMLACPFHIPRYEWDKTMPFMKKCHLCFERLKLGRSPACVEACPRGALLFGDRPAMLDAARMRISSQPDRYRSHIWGEKEYGGTSVIYISDVDLSALDWPGDSTAPIPSLTKPLITKTPMIGLGVAACLLGLNWVVQRRMKLAGERPDRQGNRSNPEENGSDV